VREKKRGSTRKGGTKKRKKKGKIHGEKKKLGMLEKHSSRINREKSLDIFQGEVTGKKG